MATSSPTRRLAGAATWPVVARAQQATMQVVGFINASSSEASTHSAAAFRAGLEEIGFVDGRNVSIEYHWLEGQYDRLPALVAES